MGSRSLAALVHRGEQGLCASRVPLPSSQELFPAGDSSAQPGPWWETLECPCSNSRAGGRWGARGEWQGGQAGQKCHSL